MLGSDFSKIPLYFDVNRLGQEISQFAPEDWLCYATGVTGSSLIILVSAGGTINDDFALSAPMGSTEFLDHSPYLKQVMNALEIPISRSYLMRLPRGIETPPQTEYNYHWFRRFAIHIPIVTHPDIKFYCHDKSIHMTAGEAWIIDNSQPYSLVNKTEEDVIHLVVETKGKLAAQAMVLTELVNRDSGKVEVQKVPYLPNQKNGINLEIYSFEVLTPEEIDVLTADIVWDIKESEMPESQVFQIVQNIEQLKKQWQTVFERFGHHNSGELSYRNLILYFKEKIAIRAKKWLLLSSKGKYALDIISSMLLTSNQRRVAKQFTRALLTAKDKPKPKPTLHRENFQIPEFEKPIFIVSAPRAGSTLLFSTLSQFPDLWTIGDESHEIIEGIPELHPAAKNFSSNCLTEADAFPHIYAILRERFAQELQDRDGNDYFNTISSERPNRLRFLEKTPKNALRIPFLKAVFPEALFIYLYRDYRENISSLIEGWRTERFIAYRQLPGWPYREWRFLLPPGWLSLKESSIPEIAAYQWKTANAYIWEDLQALPRSSWCFLRYDDLVQHPKKTIKEISKFAGLSWDKHIDEIVSQPLPLAQRNLSAPSPNKWRKHEQELIRVLPSLDPILSILDKKYVIQ